MFAIRAIAVQFVNGPTFQVGVNEYGFEAAIAENSHSPPYSIVCNSSTSQTLSYHWWFGALVSSEMPV
jgi:hypothetical protein